MINIWEDFWTHEESKELSAFLQLSSWASMSKVQKGV